jgi:hypothetical protein
MHPTPLRGEQDWCDFIIWNLHYTCIVLFLAARVKRKPLDLQRKRFRDAKKHERSLVYQVPFARSQAATMIIFAGVRK